MHALAALLRGLVPHNHIPTSLRKSPLPPVFASLLTALIVSCNMSPTGAAISTAARSSANLVQNGGFEQGGAPAPVGWTWDLQKTGHKGQVSIDRTIAHSGSASVKLAPNSNNDDQTPLAIAQLIPANAYRGKQITYSGYLRAGSGATALIGMLSIADGKALNLQMEADRSSDWQYHEHSYSVPDRPGVQVAIILAVNGHAGAAWFDDVSVSAAAPATTAAAQPTRGAPLQATIGVDARHVIRDIPPTLYGANIEWRWNATMLWQEKEDRIDPTALQLTRELGVKLIRYPGGVYSDFYHWRQGIGPRSQRPEVQHEPGKPDESRPNFGTDEALDFAKQIGAELLITVNAGTGTPQEAADWVRYVNANELRVRYWEVGNELYMNGDAPTSKDITIDPATYAERFIQFARAMRAADPRIEIGAIGGENQGRYQIVGYPDWDRIVLQRAGHYIDFLSVHNAYYPTVTDDRLDLRTVYKAMFAAPVLIERNLQTLESQIDQYAPQDASRIKIAVTEWGPWFNTDWNNRYVDHEKTLGSALYAASALKRFIESPKTTIAAFWMLNDWATLGWIGSNRPVFPPNPNWIPTARYYAFQMFTKHFGSRVVSTTTTSPTFNSQDVGFTEAVSNVPWLDVTSSLSADGSELYILAINRQFDDPINASITVNGFVPSPDGTAWTLTGTSIDANTGTSIIRVPGLVVARQAEDPRDPRFSRGSPSEITVSSASVPVGSQFGYSFPARSITSIVLHLQQTAKKRAS